MMTVHTANSDQFGMSAYPDAPFHSLAVIDGVLCALTDGGLAILDAEADEGERIDSAVEWDDSTFGDDHLKRLRDAYVAYTCPDVLLLTLRYSPDGMAACVDYELPYRVADEVTEGRFKLGRGARARSFAAGFASVGGYPFRVVSAALVLDVSERRI